MGTRNNRNSLSTDYATSARHSVFLTLCIMGSFAILSSTMSKNPVLKPFASSLGTPTDLMGVVASASTIPGILISLPAASLSDILGRRKMLLVAGVVFASAPFLYLFISVWWELAIVRFYHGFATAIFVPVAEASVAELFPMERGVRISLFSSTTYVGRGIAPFLGAAILQITNNNFDLLYLAVGVAGVTALVMGLPYLARKSRRYKTDSQETVHTATGIARGWRTIVSNRGAILVSSVQAAQFYVYGSIEFFIVGYLTDVAGFDILLTGTVSGSLIIMLIVARPFMGRLSDRIGRRTPIVVGCVGSALPLLAVPFTTSYPFLLILMILYGLGFASVIASTSALMSELVPQESIGTSMGFLDTIMDVGQTVGPIMSGLILATSLQYAGMFPSFTIILFSAGTLFLFSKTGKAR